MGGRRRAGGDERGGRQTSRYEDGDDSPAERQRATVMRHRTPPQRLAPRTEREGRKWFNQDNPPPHSSARRPSGHGHKSLRVAGMADARAFTDVEPAAFSHEIDVNLKGHFLVGQALARQMVAQRASEGPAGAIVNMSSVNARLAIASIASYNASKGGIDQLTRVMALALAEHGIRVNGVAPGTIATELAAKAVLTSDEAKARIMSRTPMKRLGQPDEIAGVVAFLLSDAASYMTGETVLVDGGRMTLNYTV